VWRVGEPRYFVTNATVVHDRLTAHNDCYQGEVRSISWREFALLVEEGFRVCEECFSDRAAERAARRRR